MLTYGVGLKGCVSIDFRAQFLYLLSSNMDTGYTVSYVGIGSNLGNRAGNLLMAVRGLMEASFEVCQLSGIYETEPVGIESKKNFLNMVAEIHVHNVSPTQMMARLLRIEYLLGRKDKSLNKPRTVDLDILFFGDVRMESEFLTLPHPRLHERKFVLCPLNEIAPNFVHPVLQKEIQHLLAETPDQCEAKRWDPNHRVPHLAAVNS
jgi:2-amino-4-hydroxy-6-hydroxymethyldihydropteridine diphosphokinase